MTTYYVDVAVGNDGNAGTSEGAGNAWASIGKAMQTVASADLVHIMGTGTYSAEDGSTGCIGKIITAGYITILGNGGEIGDGGKATLDAGVNGLDYCIGNSGGQTRYWIEGLNCINAAVDNMALGAYSSVHNCSFSSAGSIGMSMKASSKASFCEFIGNGSYGAYVPSQGVFSFCKAANNGNIGIYSGTWGSAFLCASWGNSSGQLRVGSAYPGCAISCIVDGKGSAPGIIATIQSVIANTIIHDCTTGIDGRSLFGQASKNNCFYSNDTDKTNWPDDDSDINADPMFVDAANNDYRLLPYSPCRLAGIDIGEITEGISYCDIGAHQSNPDFPSAK